MAKIRSAIEQLPQPAVTIRSRPDLRSLIGSRSLVWTVPAVRLEIAGLPASEQGCWQTRIDGHFRACGCGEGLAGALTLVGALGAYRWIDPFQQSWSGWSTFFAGLAFAAAGAGFGRIAGLVRARLKLRQTLSAFDKALHTGR